MSKADPPVVSTRTTFCGITVSLHADGSVSNRSHFIGRAKLPISVMWRVWDDICTYTHDEIPALVRAVRDGSWEPVRVRPNMTEERHQAILAGQVRTRWFDANGVLRKS
jgi:hypothetical protein